MFTRKHKMLIDMRATAQNTVAGIWCLMMLLLTLILERKSLDIIFSHLKLFCCTTDYYIPGRVKLGKINVGQELVFVLTFDHFIHFTY